MMSTHPTIAQDSNVRVRLEEIRSDPRIQTALRYCRERASQIEDSQVEITRVPAPPFGESARALHFSGELRRAGFDPHIDAVGNVLTAYEEYGPNPVVVGAHLDTVFPADTPLELERQGGVLRLPGIADNGAGLVALLWVFAAARVAGVEFDRPVVLVGSVGEEGVGDLRGIRHLFELPPWEGTECEFVALDVGGLHRITNRGLGSRRFQVLMAGPGGHSWTDFPRPNPIEGLAAAVLGLPDALTVTRREAAYNVGVIDGGISVNAIPSSARMEVELRATTEARLDAMEESFRRVVDDAAGKDKVDRWVDEIGRRPSGHTPLEAPLVRSAIEATRLQGVRPALGIGSTDANGPMSMGIPAVSVGAGGSAGNIHTRDEWYDPTDRQRGLERLLLLVAATAGVVPCPAS